MWDLASGLMIRGRKGRRSVALRREIRYDERREVNEGSYDTDRRTKNGLMGTGDGKMYNGMGCWYGQIGDRQIEDRQ